MTKESTAGVVASYRVVLFFGIGFPLLIMLLMTLNHEFRWSVTLLPHFVAGCLIGIVSGRLEAAALRREPVPNFSGARGVGSIFFVTLVVLGTILAGRFFNTEMEVVYVWMSGWGIVRFFLVHKVLSRVTKDCDDKTFSV